MSSSHPLDLFQCPLNVEPLKGDLKRLSFSTEKLFSKMPLVLLKQEASPSSTDEELVTTGVGDGVSISGESIDHDHEACGNETMDIYYQGMIQTYPGDALLLANYARFLKEVRGDGLKAEEYCERTILTSGGDGNVLSMYGGLVWSNHGDGARAQTYFDRALQSSPDDCYVMASYARFLWEWDAREEEKSQFQSNSTHINVPNQIPIPIPLTPDASYCFSKDNTSYYYT